MKNLKKGFTLSEILITLGVIGVVAAMTMPTLIANYQKKQMLTQLKKTYSTLNQAFKLSEIQNGEFKFWDNRDEIGRINYAEKYWTPFLNGAEYCSDHEKCGYKEVIPWQTLAGGRKTIELDGSANFYLPNGTFMRLNSSGWMIDTNGSKGPNIYGKDVFEFTETEKGIMPVCFMMTQKQIAERCSKETKDGACCSAKIIMLDNWQIKDDYPW